MLPFGSSEGVSRVTVSGFSLSDFAIIFLINQTGSRISVTSLPKNVIQG
jgi:hypothetical protein